MKESHSKEPHLDVTSFTVNAVGSIDDQPHLSLLSGPVRIEWASPLKRIYLVVGLVFIHSGRTEPTLRSSILGLHCNQ